ncbi:26S proteasome non-ATPase regulatory subunit [Entamoeba marina]
MLERLPEEIKMQVLLDYEGISQKFRSELIKKLPELYHPYIDGKIQEKLYLNFLFSMEKTDNLLLNNIKAANCIKNSVIQTCVLYANAYMHYGTTNVMFLKDNNEWIINSSNWAKYATTAKTGTGGKSVYAQSGRLYALGLIFSGHGQEVLPDMLEDLKHSKTTGSEVVQHGACLGIGLAGVGSEDMEIFHEVKDILISSNSAVAGMTAGMAMGLVMMGTGDIEVCAEMINQCHNTKHSKIIRGTGVGISLIMFGMQQKADIVIGQMINDADAVVRYGGMFTIAMAYCGTANEDAIKQLLHYSVTDSSDEVKRAAVLCLGFVLSKRIDELCKTIHLLIDSYNPHIRFGSALALGIAGASSNNPHVIKLLEPLLKDPTDFVKQGAYIAMGMVYMEASVKESPNITKFVDGLQEKIMSKSEGMLTQFGCILGLGVLNAGGRNCCITMTNVLGTFNMKAIAGLVLFSQYWYWYPFTLTLSLAFTPTTIIGVTPDLKVAKTFQYCSNAPTSTFDYLPMTKPKTKTGPAKMNQTTLSYTKKALGTSTNLSSSLLVTDKMKEELIPEEKVMEEVVEEQPFVILENGSRVTQRQMQFIQEVDGNRYVPVKKFTRGIMILRDTQPQMEEDNDGILKEAANETEMTDDHKMLTEALLTQNAEPAPPEPFEWKFN